MHSDNMTFSFLFFLIIHFQISVSKTQSLAAINPGFQATQSQFNDTNGQFLSSKNSQFTFGFYSDRNITNMFFLGIIHIPTSRIIWTANPDILVENWDKFIFDNTTGNVFLESQSRGTIWSTNTDGKNTTQMVLLESGNLVLLSKKGTIIWQSFDFPTNTLLQGQVFKEGMRLKSYSDNKNFAVTYLEIQSGDLVLFAGYEQEPQIYWSISSESRKTNNNVSTRYVKSFSIVSNSLIFYDREGALLWKFFFSQYSSWSSKWAAVLDPDGSISFHDLQKGNSNTFRIPENNCSTPEPCNPYFICYSDGLCQCPSMLSYKLDCKPEINHSCNNSNNSTNSPSELLYLGENIYYFALPYISPFMKSSLNSCQEACLNNCSCSVLFFENSSGNCFFFDRIGSLQRAEEGSAGYVLYMKVSKDNINSDYGGAGNIPPSESKQNVTKHIVLMSLLLVLVGMIIIGLNLVFWYHRKMREFLESSTDSSAEDNFLDNLSGMPVRFRYSQLRRATKNFSTKVGQGGFGSVYLGVLPDGMRLAVKKLERIGQGAKEFRAEVSLIGSTHHFNLVKLKGFCSEGHNRLLVYEYMSNGSLDRWIFKNGKAGPPVLLDWYTRFNIALSMAKALAYLHQECEVKIVHCDIKPENVLLDENFVAKVSDFGLAKLMNREQSFVCTQLRGTRGYVAPEWITNLAISDKSDVYSFGMVLLEIIGGRKNYDSEQPQERVNFPSFAFQMLEEHKLREIVDPELEVKEDDTRVEVAIQVALWCIQEEMHFRPPMSKVVQMLEGLCTVPDPPTSTQMRSSISWSSGFGTTSTTLFEFNGQFSEVRVSDVRLSGPR